MDDWTRVDWESRYAAGSALNRYPFDQVVSFMFRHGKPGDRVLEIGCGAGNNVWFLAREGFVAAGIDISPSAIAAAEARLAADGLEADLRVGDFHQLPWPDDDFDFVVDRSALVCSNEQKRALVEIARVLRPHGRFLSMEFD